MEKFQRILAHPLFLEELDKISSIEKDRVFCKHTLSHLLDVCRIMQIHTLENTLPFSKDILYACGLLHDIGRSYEDHHLHSAEIAKTILPQCHYSADEITKILTAIKSHRQNNSADDLAQLLYRADKESRGCFLCKARESCNWPKERQNNTFSC